MSPEQEMVQILAQQLFGGLRGAFGLAFDIKRGQQAALRAANDLIGLAPMLEQLTPGGRQKVWCVELVRVSDIIGSDATVLVSAGVKLDRGAWRDNSAPMFAATVLALATSPIARAFLYYEGYELKFKLATVVERPPDDKLQ